MEWRQIDENTVRLSCRACRSWGKRVCKLDESVGLSGGSASTPSASKEVDRNREREHDDVPTPRDNRQRGQGTQRSTGALPLSFSTTTTTTTTWRCDREENRRERVLPSRIGLARTHCGAIVRCAKNLTCIAREKSETHNGWWTRTPRVLFMTRHFIVGIHLHLSAPHYRKVL